MLALEHIQIETSWLALVQRTAYDAYRADLSVRRASGLLGTLEVGGRELPRLADRPLPPSPRQQELLDFFFRHSVEEAPPEVQSWIDYRSPEAAAAVLAQPALSSVSEPRLGKVTIFRSGIGNCVASPAQLFRIAQHTGTLIISYNNPHPATKARLRRPREIGGVGVPRSLRGKIVVIGSSAKAMLTFEQASDTFLEQLEALRRARDVLGFDVLASRATVIGHSQAPLDIALSRRRLIDAGLPDAIGRLISLGGAFQGSAMVGSSQGRQYVAGAFFLGGEQAFRTVEALNPERARAFFGPEFRALIDLGVAARIGEPFSLESNRNIRPRFRLLASILRGDGFGENNDGLVTEASATFGKRALVLPRPYDHTGLIGDPAIIDDVLRALED